MTFLTTRPSAGAAGVTNRTGTELLMRATRTSPASENGTRVLLTLVDILESHHPELSLHGQEVGRHSALTAHQLGMSDSHAERVGIAGTLHDIGKIGIPHWVLEKPGPLTAREWEQIRAHPEIGARLLRAAGLGDIAAWVLAHHERFDGLGYPIGLEGDEIPLEARILAVTDSYDAMTSDRTYRLALGHEQAIDELHYGAGGQFDPDVVDAFLSAVELA